VDSFGVDPEIRRELPQRVSVTDWPKFGQDFYNNIRREYAALRRSAEADQVAVMRYHSPAGEVIYVSQVSLYENSNALLIYGSDGVSPCVVVATAQSAHIIMKLITPDETTAQHERRPVAFE
jgi:hypothetical protein